MPERKTEADPCGPFHPCFHEAARTKRGRLHLPVARSCNIVCGYCDRRYDCANESRPGVTSRLMSPREAVEHAARVVREQPDITVAGIAGPGDPLAEAETSLETLALLKARLPHLHGCVATNGLVLAEHVRDLWDVGVRFVTVTVNAVTPEVGTGIYGRVLWKGRWLTGREGAGLLWSRQREGIAALKRKGFTVKINMVLVPGRNEGQVNDVAQAVAGLGADVMNLIGLVPVPGTPLGGLKAPDDTLMESLRGQAGRFLPQMAHCARCRADAAGLLTCPQTPGLRTPFPALGRGLGQAHGAFA